MKAPIRITFLLAALVLAMPVGASGFQSERAIAAGEVDVAAMLTGLERQRARAILRRDVPTLLYLMDRQYLHIDSRGRVRSKTELMTALERDAFRFRIYEIETNEVQLLDKGSTALSTGSFRSLQAGASARPFRGRFVHLWVRQPDGWKNTFHQATAIRPAGDACPCD